ncbi:MAG TPA: hypothetical protein VLA05_01400 [Coriobacteriia bacterium]|nr:hypothetical protein [Coriobacteriia bacterium]
MVTTAPSIHPLAELYRLWALNPLVEIARVMSFDVPVRPQNYRQLTDETTAILSGFRFKMGTDPEWPDAFQRALNFKVLCQVSLASPALREAALRYGDAANDHSRESFNAVAVSCRSQLAPLEGHALSLLADRSRTIFQRAVTLLRDPAVARAFGVSPAPAGEWPLSADFNGEAAYMVAELVRGLRVIACLGGTYKRINRANPTVRPFVPLLTIALPQDKFLKLQRAAYYGSRTISLVMGDEQGPDSLDLTESAYQWTKALQGLVPDVARAWKDVEYRGQLSDLEWGMAPNPSGDMTPVSVGAALAFSTSTVSGEICCCSGDLDCDPTTQLTDFCSEYQCPA